MTKCETKILTAVIYDKMISTKKYERQQSMTTEAPDKYVKNEAVLNIFVMPQPFLIPGKVE